MNDGWIRQEVAPGWRISFEPSTTGGGYFFLSAANPRSPDGYSVRVRGHVFASHHQEQNHPNFPGGPPVEVMEAAREALKGYKQTLAENETARLKAHYAKAKTQIASPEGGSSGN